MNALPDKKSKGRENYLTPLTGPPKDKSFAVFDIESKEGDSQKAGFTRPFMVGFYAGDHYISFRDEPQLSSASWYGRCTRRGGCVDKLMQHLLGDNPKRKSPFAGMDIYAHNMGSFDGLFLPAWLEQNHQWVSYKIMPVTGRIQSIEIWRCNPHRYRADLESRKRADKKDREQFGVIRILDSFRIMPSSLDKIAKSFGLEGKLNDMDLNAPETDPLWEKYNEVDVVQLFEVIKIYKKMIMELLGGEVGITAPSAAIKLLRRKYLPENFEIRRNIHFDSCTNQDECLGCAHEFFRQAYFGGRTEIYTLKGTGWYFDVNSSYPFSMTKPQPVGRMFELGENVDFTRYSNNPQKYVGFVACTVEIPEDTYLPPLPVQHEGKLKFPAGVFSGVWDWIELEALKRIGGKILHVEKSVWLESFSFLGRFVNDLYAMRKKGGPMYKGVALSEIAKIMLNSTFGKFGMDQDRIEMMILKPGDPEPWEARYPGESKDHGEKRKRAEKSGSQSYRVVTPLPGESEERFEERKKLERLGVPQAEWHLPDLNVPDGIFIHDSPVRIREIRVDAAYIIPQIAAHITASSRFLLWSYSMDIIERGFHVFYSDTDSIITDYNGFADSKELGGLKREYDEEITIECFRPKMYRLTKATPFSGEHQRDLVDGKRACLTCCPGCLKDDGGKTLKDQHVTKDDQRSCLKTCPGCSFEKVLLKGVTRDLRTTETIRKLVGGEEIVYQQHEKLGILAKRGFRDTPKMATIRKSMKSKYDKRRLDQATGETKPIILSGERYLSFCFRSLPESYAPPTWLVKMFPRKVLN